MKKNLPLIEFGNLFEADQFGQKFWKAHLGSSYDKYKTQYELRGKAGAEATKLSEAADKHPPQLKTHNSVGERVDEVVYHPAHRTLEELSFGQGIVAQKYQSPLVDVEKGIRHFVGFSTGYYFAQTEPGLYCPICMTDALAFVIEKHQGKIPQVKKTVERIGSQKMEELWQGAMFLTEIQGGSDVGASTARAEKQGEDWLIHGDKWFCSNVDAESALVLARLPGEEGDLKHGTKGLGLFLYLRDEPSENHRKVVVHRLKDKLGVKSMASGEVTFHGAKAFLLAGFGEGFKMMAEMVNMSRLYNSVASLAVSRRSLLEAKAFAEKRQVFGKSLVDQPLWRSTYADLFSEFVLLKTLTFETIKALDQGECGDEEAKKLSRILTPVCKALTGKLSVFMASECMELIGGNAYIEEHILPRLLRDAQVLPIWEGTTHIQSLDALRGLRKEGFEILERRLRKALEASVEKDIAEFLAKEQKALFDFAGEVSQMSQEDMQRASRALLEKVGRVAGLSFLVELSRHAELKEVALAGVRRFMGKSHFCQSPSAHYSSTNSGFEKAFL